MAVVRLREVSVRYPTYTPNSRSIKTVILSKLGGTMRVHDNTLVVEALNKLDLELADGDRLAIVGDNGAGLQMLELRYWLHGLKIAQLRATFAMPIAYVSWRAAAFARCLDARMSARDIVQYHQPAPC